MTKEQIDDGDCNCRGMDRDDGLHEATCPVYRRRTSKERSFYDRVAERAIIETRHPLALFAVCSLCAKRTDSLSLHRMDPESQHNNGCPLEIRPVETTAPLDYGMAAIFVDRWLWHSPARKSTGESWTTSQKADVIQMLVDSRQTERSAVEPSPLQPGEGRHDCPTCTCGPLALPPRPLEADTYRCPCGLTRKACLESACHEGKQQHLNAVKASGEYQTYPGEPITGIYEAGVAIVRLGKDDEATGE